MSERLKRWIFRLLGKEPEAVVVSFASGDPELCRRMVEEVRSLVPDRRYFVVTDENWPEMRSKLKRYRIGLAPVMLSRDGGALRRAAFLRAPHKILAYNSRLERHHLRLDLSSLLFWLGVPLDRIHLRPWWWPTPKRDRSFIPGEYTIIEGRPCSDARRRVAVLSPYYPFPLGHGGAVRIYNLLREMACCFDVELFAFTDGDAETAPIAEHCARVVLVGKPRYREPRWSTLLPPEVHEFRSTTMRRALAEERRNFGFELLQVEYTQLAEYGGDVLVEHDVTFDLFTQILRRERTMRAWWDYFRWRRFETRAVERYRRVVVMSPKDAGLLGAAVKTIVIENGVDLSRFCPEPEQPGENLLFIGSFRHFPNVQAFRFFSERVWPLLVKDFPTMQVTVICGPDHLSYWRAFSGTPEPPVHERIRMLGFVSDVRALYHAAHLALVPTPVSAGTNVKVLEAMAMQRAVVSTSSGCAGLGLIHGESVWVGDTPEAFAEGVATLIRDPNRRRAMAAAAYGRAISHFDWKKLGAVEREMLRELLEHRPAT
ncbi:MAG: glycosyltransferase [Acidobacteriia bacterium]|nr:glycosyltransferase [Terriglobia bacterium]